MRRAAGMAIVLLTVGFLACTNDPFDPASVENARPVMSFFVEPVDPDDALNPTSYFERTFHWSGTDRDGQVVEYYVSVRPDSAIPAPWDTTTRTDTTMTFTTDDLGQAEATFYLACRDDQGALSDTLVRYLPLRNFPPAVNFQSDYDPRPNLQREITAANDTIFWNYGAMSMRLFAFDLDGNATMDAFYRYTCADEDPDTVLAWDDPAADPMRHWLQAPFPDPGADILDFEVQVAGLEAGQRTLTVAVADEAAAVTRFSFSWEVREPQGSVLVIPDNSLEPTREFYREFLAEYLGPDGWSEYEFKFGYPDNDFVLLQTMRLFDLVFWFDGSGTSTVLENAAMRDGVLETYLTADGVHDPGQLLMISRNLTGASSGLPYYFRQTIIGVNPTGAPQSTLEPANAALGIQALGTQDWLPPMTLETRQGRGIGLILLEGSEELYRFESCTQCFGRRPPWDPIIGVRRPDRTISEFARTVGISYQLETMVHDEAKAALAALFTHELGVTAP